MEVPQSIERRIVRKAPRLGVSLHATLLAPEPVPALIVDLSIGGARIAVDAGVQLTPRQQVAFCALELKATVLALEPTGDANHPNVASYRVQFEPLADVRMLTLHTFVSGSLAMDLDSFGRLIALIPGHGNQ